MKLLYRVAVAAALAVSVLGFASPAGAHPGHASCAAGAATFTVPLAQSGELGALASTLARQGAVGEFGAELHATGCAPR